jgi:protein TonB
MTASPPTEPRDKRPAPMARALLLSACLHGAAIALIQPSPATDRPRMLVISARLQPPRVEPVATVTPAPAEPATSSPAIAEPAPATPMPLAVAERESISVPTPPAPAPPPTPTPAPTPAPTSTPVPAPAAAEVETREETPPPTRVGPPGGSPLPSLPLGIDDTWYLARQVDTHPKAVARIEPAYPEEARRGNVEGTLKIRIRIDELGRVVQAEVVEARPPRVFDRVTLDAFRDARFHPALRDGRPVRYEAYIRVDFRLEN